MPYLYIALAFSFNAVANIFLKLGSRSGFNLSSFSPIDLVSHNWQFILGCLLFVANVPFYFLALRSLPISVAYPVMVVMSFVIINAYAFTFLKEEIVFAQVVGYVFLVIGLILVVAYTK